MNKNKSIVIAGHGYADCLMAASLVALKECLHRRDAGLLMSSQASLARLLRGFVNRVMHHARGPEVLGLFLACLRNRKPVDFSPALKKYRLFCK